jgi:hypothetical protein
MRRAIRHASRRSAGGLEAWAFHSLSSQLSHFDHARNLAPNSFNALSGSAAFARAIAVEVELRRWVPCIYGWSCALN